MAELLTIARPYAKAAFDYAFERSSMDSWSKTLKMLAALVQDRDFSAYLNRPEITPAQQTEALQKTLQGDVGQNDAVNFIRLLAENGRLAVLPEISQEFEQLKAQKQNQVDVVIETAFPLTPEQEQKLVGRLAVRFNSMINAKIEVNPALIAGVVIRAGDQVIDDSALNKLEKMRTRLLAQ